MLLAFGLGAIVFVQPAEAAVRVEIISTSAPDGTIGLAYSTKLTATGGTLTAPVTWVVSGGALPTGLKLSAGGTISGTPTVAARFSFSVTASDASTPRSTATQAFSITVAPMEITSNSLPDAPVAAAYKAAVTYLGGRPTVAVTIASGALPPGLVMSSAGTISGTPTSLGTYSFTVKASDASTPKNTATKSLSISVTPMAITTTSLPDAPVAATYSAALTRSGGKATVVYTITSGALPPGITMSSGGVFGGAPTTVGTSAFTVKLTDASTPKKTATALLSISVTPMAITTTSLPDAPVAATYSAALTRSGGKATVVYTITSGALPPGITMSSGGVFGGAPTTVGTSAFTVKLTDASTPKKTATALLSISVTPMAITTTSLPDAPVAATYSAALTRSGGKATVVYTITSGALPPGITMSSGGVFGGAPTTVGTSAFTVKLTDASTPKKTATALLSIRVTPMRITTTSLAFAIPGVPYKGTIGHVGGKGAGTLAVTWGALPPGVTMSSAGALTGTPTQFGSYPFQVTLTDGSTPKKTAVQYLLMTVTRPGHTDDIWKTVAPGRGHTCGLKVDGTAWCWGDNTYGQLGSPIIRGDERQYLNPIPIQVGTDSDWASLVSGEIYSCAVKTNGTAWCWGYNWFGQLGTATNTGTANANPVPTQVGTDSDWKSLTAGTGHVCGLRTNGTAWCWGDNEAGELGATTNAGTRNPNPAPTQVGTDSDWASLTAGFNDTCGVKTDSTAWCWGDNYNGQLGDAINARTRNPNPTPTKVRGDDGWAALTAGVRYTCGLRTNGTAWCWGDYEPGDLGNNNPAYYGAIDPIPTQVGTDTDWANLTASGLHTCGVKTNGSAWCWGENYYGVLGNTTNVNSYQDNPVPSQVGEDVDWMTLVTGQKATCGLKTNGTGWCWGDNSNGSLGNSLIQKDGVYNPYPTQVNG